MTRWHSLYCYNQTQDETHTAIEQFLQAQDYTRYDAFGLMPGRAYSQTIKTFTAPQAGQWVRVLAEASHLPDLDQLAVTLSQQAICIVASLEGKRGSLLVYENGGAVEDIHSALLPYIKPDVTSAELEQAVAGKAFPQPLEDEEAKQIGDINLDDVPEEYKGMVRKVDARQASKLFRKLTQQLLGTADPQASKMLQQEKPDWNGPVGRRIRSVMACLTVPQDWREPDFTTVRLAYPLHLRLQRNPNAPSYPGDEEALQAVPDALDYRPAYGGKDE